MKRHRTIIIGLLFFAGLVATGVLWAGDVRQDRLMSRCDGTIVTPAKTQCWEDVVRESLKTGGIEGAFRYITAAYTRYPDFAKTCHEMVHIVGQAAYSQFKTGKSVPLSERAAICSFGFYHGFMEMLVARKGTISEAQAFCEYVDQTLGTVTPGARLGCFHGIGHGATDVHNPAYFGNERALVASALPTCEAFARDGEQLKLCVTGIFDSISLAYYNDGENGLVMKKDDPLWLCHEQPDKYKEPCYLDMMPAVIWMGGHDLTRATPIVLTHAEDKYKEISIKTLAENSVRFIMHKKPATAYVSHCRALGDRFALHCIRGLGSGVMQFGPPGREHEGALAFCRDQLLNWREQDACMEEVLSYVRIRYGKQVVRRICGDMEEAYRRYCRE